MKTLLHGHRRTRAYSGLLTPDYILKFNTYLLAVVVPKCLTGRDHLFPLRNIYCLHCQKLIKRNIGTGDKNLSDHSNLSWMFQISDNFFWRLSNGRAHHGLPITRIVLYYPYISCITTNSNEVARTFSSLVARQSIWVCLKVRGQETF